MQNEKYLQTCLMKLKKEILRLITTNNWDLFISSPQFRMAALILAHVSINKSNPQALTNGANPANNTVVAPYAKHH